MTYAHLATECEEHHGLVRDFGGSPDRMARPKIVVLCGSTRFKDAFTKANRKLTLDGRIVLSVGMFPHADSGGAPEDVLGAGVKAALDALHKRKIDLADEVLVLNVGGYIGESTRSEIAYAESIGRMVFYLEHEVGWPTRPVTPVLAAGGDA